LDVIIEPASDQAFPTPFLVAAPSGAGTQGSLPMQSEGGELALMITRRELLETSVAQLQTLAAFLSDQLSETAHGSAGLETRACKEILCAVSRLIQIHQSRRSR
jgi:hypothetical protein